MPRLTVGAYRARHALATAVTWCSGDGPGPANALTDGPVNATASRRERTTRHATARLRTASASVRG